MKYFLMYLVMCILFTMAGIIGHIRLSEMEYRLSQIEYREWQSTKLVQIEWNKMIMKGAER